MIRLTRSGARWGRGVVSPALFQNLEKKCPNFGQKMLWLCPYWIKLLILNVVLRVSRRKKPIFFPCGAFLSCVVDEMFIDVPWFRENSPALKDSWLRAWRSSTGSFSVSSLMTYIFRVSYVLQLVSQAFRRAKKKTETRKITKEYEKLGRYLSYCSGLLCNN